MLCEDCVMSAEYAAECAMPRAGAVDDLAAVFSVVWAERSAPVWMDLQHMLDEYAAHVFVEHGAEACNDVYDSLGGLFEGRV